MNGLIAAFVASLIALAIGIAQSKYKWLRYSGMVVFIGDLILLAWSFVLLGLCSKEASILQKPHLYLVVCLSRTGQMLRVGSLLLHQAMHQVVLLCAHAPCVEICLRVGRSSQFLGLPASIALGSPALLPSNSLPCGKRATWLVVQREPGVDKETGSLLTGM